jgi:hypothetical protein
MIRSGRASVPQTSDFAAEIRATLTLLLAVAGALLGRRAAIILARDVAMGGFQASHDVLWAGGDLALMTLRQRRN